MKLPSINGRHRGETPQAEAFAGSVFRLLGLDLRIPDHTTLSRRSGEFATRRPRMVARARHLIVDSTG
jgi:Transposase DDE domain